MKYTILVLALSLATGCKRSTQVGEYFIFGRNFGDCRTNCVQHYLLKNNRLYKDARDHTTRKHRFGKELPASSVELAKALKDKLPELLKTQDSGIFGCPDCLHQGTYLIEIRESGKTRTHKIDTDTSALPASLRSFASELKRTLEMLPD